jgi:hypothetical protein
VLRWASENLLQLKPEEIGEHYGRYRLHVPEAERARLAGRRGVAKFEGVESNPRTVSRSSVIRRMICWRCSDD